MEKAKQELIGKVVSDKNDKAIKHIHYMVKELNILKNMLLMMKRMKQK